MLLAVCTLVPFDFVHSAPSIKKVNPELIVSENSTSRFISPKSVGAGRGSALSNVISLVKRPDWFCTEKCLPVP